VRILLVEDEDSIRSALTRAFERDGHEVRAAASLAEAREILAAWTPEVAVSDLKLPDGDGIELAGTLGVPFIMLSGYATYDDAVRALRCGAVDFFTKPVAIKDVRSALARVNPAPQRHPAPAWCDADGALAAIRELVLRLPGRLARLAAAELVQAAPDGRLVAYSDAAGTRMWLDGHVDWSVQADRMAWLRIHGIEVQAGERSSIAYVSVEEKITYSDTDELLWPETLIPGRAVQTQQWQTVGSWILAELRAGAGPLAGLRPELLAHCEAAGVSVPTAPASLVQPGVGDDERAGLLAEDDLGPPIA
jgi:CheY-like chemotaxis protein